jgi:serine/threonine protein kinase
MMLDICEGMAYLHSSTNADGSEKKELFHQDLKSANVLLTEVDETIRAKIGDFGLSCMLFKSSKYFYLVMKQAEKGATDEVRLNGGTRCYQAPVCWPI